MAPNPHSTTRPVPSPGLLLEGGTEAPCRQGQAPLGPSGQQEQGGNAGFQAEAPSPRGGTQPRGASRSARRGPPAGMGQKFSSFQALGRASRARSEPEAGGGSWGTGGGCEVEVSSRAGAALPCAPAAALAPRRAEAELVATRRAGRAPQRARKARQGEEAALPSADTPRGWLGHSQCGQHNPG